MNKDGFTLIEALVAITILLVGVIGPLGLAAQGIADGLFAKNQIVANYLAQEAAELVINRRDSNIYAGGTGNWLAGLDGCDESSPCSIDALTAQFTDCGGAPACGALQYYTRDQVFADPAAHPGDPNFTDTTFYRTVYLKPASGSNDNERVAEIKVRWLNHAAERELILDEYLYNYE